MDSLKDSTKIVIIVFLLFSLFASLMYIISTSTRGTPPSSVSPPQQPQDEKEMYGKASISGNGTVSGELIFIQIPGKGLTINGQISGLTPGQHGLHVHEFGDLSNPTNKCASTGPHYNPENKTHGGLESEIRHKGDLGNIVASANGVANVNITVKELNLSSIAGRAIVVHEKADDLGMGKTTESSTTGSAGTSLACGIITIIDAPSDINVI
jgi:Cu-Zn family superoxide dismutase